jgi:hypothetical protein
MANNLRRRLIEKAIAILDEGSTLLAVGIDDFFEGNTDEQCIAVNVLFGNAVGLAGIRRLLTDILDRPEVQDVFIELTEIPDPDEGLDEGIWPSAFAVFIVTSAPLDEVENWVAALHPRDVREGWCVAAGIKTPISESALHSGMRPIRVWLL